MSCRPSWLFMVALLVFDSCSCSFLLLICGVVDCSPITILGLNGCSAFFLKRSFPCLPSQGLAWVGWPSIGRLVRRWSCSRHVDSTSLQKKVRVPHRDSNLGRPVQQPDALSIGPQMHVSFSWSNTNKLFKVVATCRLWRWFLYYEHKPTTGDWRRSRPYILWLALWHDCRVLMMVISFHNMAHTYNGVLAKKYGHVLIRMVIFILWHIPTMGDWPRSRWCKWCHQVALSDDRRVLMITVISYCDT